MSNPACPLCESNTSTPFYKKAKGEEYFDCPICSLVYLSPKYFLSNEDEKEHYQTHNNNVEDIRYQNFVSPITNYILANFKSHHHGLDFGAGTGPVISHLLNQKEYQVNIYDPFFHQNPKVLEEKYDYIFSCEVVEHFHAPAKEFQILKGMLNPNAQILIKTELFYANVDFPKWYYHQDKTHVCFYRPETFTWIKNHFSFEQVIINNNLVVLK